MTYVRLATNEPDGSLLSGTVTAKIFFVGLAMGSYDHDYRVVHGLLALLRARRVSKRIWLVTIEQDVERVVSLLKKSLADADGALMVECPATMNPEDWAGLPAFDGAEPSHRPAAALPRQAEGFDTQGRSDGPVAEGFRESLQGTLARVARLPSLLRNGPQPLGH